ncbi:MAG: hypothetical protein R3F19_04380 [Verrucomicrobiales bacterium]
MDIQFGQMKSKLISITLSLIGFCLAVYLYINRDGYLVRTYDSPDGEFTVEVYSYREWFVAPGDSGQGRGYVVLRNDKGKVLESRKANGVGTIDTVRWSESNVDIKLFATWDLP